MLGDRLLRRGGCPGEKARFYLFDIDGTLVTFVAEAWAEGDFDAVMSQSQPVLDSITWG